MPTPDDLSVLRTEPFSEAVEQLEDLLIHTRRAFLIGAGCSRCAGLPLTSELTRIAIDSGDLDSTSKEILTAIANLFYGATNAHIEDYLSELVDLLAISDRRVAKGAIEVQVPVGINSYSNTQLHTGIEEIKKSLSNAIDKLANVDVHRQFVRAVHRPVRVGKAISSTIVDYLVLNYDTLIEDALALERIPFSDGLDGGATGWWNPDTFNRDGLVARVLKLHGSVDWCDTGDNHIPRRIASNVQLQDPIYRRIVIWPASTKYREAQLDPFAQLADRARRAMRPGPGTQRTLVICGYSFSDAHINIEIDTALRESGGDLTVIAFTDQDELVGQLQQWHQDADLRDHVLIFARRGYFHGSTEARITHDLPWWKFENVVRLLRGER